MATKPNPLREPDFRISAARLRLMQDRNCGLFAEIGYALAATPTDALPTMATDGKHLFYRPEYVDGIDDAELETTLLHEFVHVANLHPLRFDPKRHDQQLANVAMDYADNLQVAACGRTIPKTWLFDQKYDGMAWEAIYTLLKQQQPPQQQQQQPDDAESDETDENAEIGAEADASGSDKSDSSDAGNTKTPPQDADEQGAGKSPADDPAADGNQPGKPAPGKSGDRSGDVMPYPGKDGQPADETERAQAEAQLSDQIMRVAQAQQMAGHGSANLARFLDKITTPRDPDLYEALAQLLERAPNDRTWRKQSRRMMHAGIYPGAEGEECPPLVIVIDTSGSISDAILAAFDSKVRRAVADFRPRAVTLIYCDDEINGEPDTFTPDDMPTLTPHGGGGTDFRPPFGWVAENMPEQPAALVYLTDLEGPAPTEPTPYPTIWAAIPSTWRPTAPTFGQIVPLIL